MIKKLKFHTSVVCNSPSRFTQCVSVKTLDYRIVDNSITVLQVILVNAIQNVFAIITN